MLRELALRRALEDARDRRSRELEDMQGKSRALRRRLRELTDRLAAMGHVHARFAPPEVPRPAEETTEATPEPAPVTAEPVTEPKIAPLPVRRPEEQYGATLRALGQRFPGGFTTSQLRDVLDETESGKAHTYDAAWTLANTFLRSRVFELAGTRPGPTGAPIRVYRVSPKVVLPAEAS